PGMGSDTTPDMMMTGPLGISTDRQGSGTTWQPEAVLMPFRHAIVGGWDIMSHWNVFAQYDRQFGARGQTQIGSVNWSMVMASRPLLGGRLQLRAMNSLEPATLGRCGYPHLLQSGETCRGVPNADRQHPHDLFMETAALYERGITPSLAWSVYVAPSGEPAVGPVAFMHRASAVNDPMSNITHHWQDATHITFGVVTGAVYGKRWKVEGSVFNGREPDENRWNFDLNGARFSSYAGRFTFNPSNEWSLSASLAHLDGHDEVIHGAVRRASVSVLQSHDFGGGRTIASALVWGANRPTGESAENSFLAETNVELDSKNSVFVRAERVAKSAADLALGTASGVGPYPATGVALGYVREVGTFGVFSTGLGVRGSVTFVPESLESTYGTRHPAGLVAFLRVRPKRMTAAELAEMHEQMRK
ncbi:MAG TPA: hypothetical protein VIP11_18140, partial [Gemmatimonadaceae bacterium]